MPVDAEWGHALITPEGAVIRVPEIALVLLRRLGLLLNNKARLHPNAYQFVQPQYDCLTNGLRHMLGADLTGPAWCVCACRECRKKEADADQTMTPEYRLIDRRTQADEAVRHVRQQREMHTAHTFSRQKPKHLEVPNSE